MSTPDEAEHDFDDGQCNVCGATECYKGPCPGDVFDRPLVCVVDGCANEVACMGSYDGHPEVYACDEHCGHGNEDGWCTQRDDDDSFDSARAPDDSFDYGRGAGPAAEDPRSEARSLARRWPWSVAPHERKRLHQLVREWMAARKSNDDMDADIGRWLGRDTDDAHAIASEAAL